MVRHLETHADLLEIFIAPIAQFAVKHLHRALKALPQIVPFLGALAGGLSGGQRQAVAIGRALMANPDVLLLDEVSLGLSPAAVSGVYDSLGALASGRAMTMVIVEQDLSRALAFADQIICMAEGEIGLAGRPSKLTKAAITQAYFGIAPAGAADA
jgi:branched-chain amino acid transport system ATP-binding protein